MWPIPNLFLRSHFIGLMAFAFTLTVPPLSAQSSSPRLEWAIEGGSSLSFTGLNINLAAKAQWGEHEFFVGPKWALSDTYLLERGPWGLDVGYRWNMVQKKKIMGFASVEYQVVFLKPGNNDRRARVHEGHWAYGFQWQVSERMRIGNKLGLGAVMERSRLTGSDEVYSLTGFSLLFKIFASYRFGPKEKADD